MSVYDMRMPRIPQSCDRWKARIDRRFGTTTHDVDIPDFDIVMPYSAAKMRMAVYKIARIFQRENEYDFCQYGYNGQEDEYAPAFIWTDDDPYTGSDIVVGACCFRYREYRNAPHGWALQWVWLHPLIRGKGRLADTWPFFKRVFGEHFYVEPPLSKPMKRFLAKHGHVDACDLLTKATPTPPSPSTP